MLLILLVLVVSFVVTFLSVPILIRKFSGAKITGKDIHKPGKPEIPEMGGLAVVAGLTSGVLCSIALVTLSHSSLAPQLGLVPKTLDLTEIFAALTTILIIAIIGIFDDVVRLRQGVKAILPIFAAIPLVAIGAGISQIYIPFIGSVSLPLIYPILLIPIGIAVITNLTNMYAGFNGMEAGLGLVASAGLLPIAYKSGSIEALILLLALSSALFAFFIYNRFPARIFPGDVGTLTIGATLGSAAILGNFEFAVVLVMIPYIADFAIKAKNKFPSSGWWGILDKDGKLHSPEKPIGLAQYILKLTGGLTEKRAVAIFMLIEAIFVAIALSMSFF